MKVLLITSRVPFPARGGYPIVVNNTIRALVNEGAEVHVFSLNPRKYYVDTRQLKDPLMERIQFDSCKINTDVNAFDAFRNLLSSKSYNISRFYKNAATARLKNILRLNSYDVIQLEGLYVVPYLPLLRQLSKAHIIYRSHNIEHRIWENLAQTESFPLKRLYLSLLVKRLRKFETGQLNSFDSILCISEQDKHELKYMGCKLPVETSPVYLDPAEYLPDTQKMAYPSVFHLGSLDWRPNREGVEWFLENVWKDLEELRSRLKLHIAGSNIPKAFFGFQDEDIHLHPNVEDVKEFINSKSVMIVPLRAGSGMRVKIIQAMALKKCIISTSIAAEGINYEHGNNILIADSKDEFYKYILKCSTDRRFTERIGENARKLFEREHGLRANARKLISFYQKAVLV